MRRVLHVLKIHRPDFSGEGVFLERSSAAMHELAPGVAHDLLVTHTPRPADPSSVPSCPTLGRVDHLTDRPLGAVRHEAALVLWFLRNLRRYDAVHFRTHADWYFLTYLLTRLSWRRLILSATLDDSLPVLARQYRPSLRRIAARAFRLFDAYVSISPKLLRETLSAGADPARCHLVPCGVTATPQPPEARGSVRAGIGAGPADPVLLFIGGLCRRKDPGFLVETFPAVLAAAPDARLVLVGPPLEPDTVAELEGRVRAFGLETRVTIIARHADPHPWFAAADAFVFASRLEGFGTVVPEAMAHGLPVVARRLPGVNDGIVVDGETGILFDGPRDYVAAVARLLGDPALRERMGAAGRAVARSRFGMREVARRYLAIYGMDPADAPGRDAAPVAGVAAGARRWLSAIARRRAPATGRAG